MVLLQRMGCSTHCRLKPHLSVRVAAGVQSIYNLQSVIFQTAKFQSVIVQSCNFQSCKFCYPPEKCGLLHANSNSQPLEILGAKGDKHESRQCSNPSPFDRMGAHRGKMAPSRDERAPYGSERPYM